MNQLRKTHLCSLVSLMVSLNLFGLTLKNRDAEQDAGIRKNIISITPDSIVLVSGSTFSYTVDTPEGEGWVDTTPTVREVIQSLEEGYQLYDKAGRIKTEGRPTTGDYIALPDSRGKINRKCRIVLKKAALRPDLQLHRRQLTTGVQEDILLDFYAGQRSPMATVEFRLPPEIDITLDNTTVNVIGRGEVTLRDLPRQSIGRTGTHYSYNKVGNVSIRDEGEKGKFLLFTGLDLRPSNGPDLRICFKGASFTRKGEYGIEAVYTTSQPEIYVSPVERVTFETVNALTDFSRETMKAFTYDPGYDFTSTSFHWTPAANAKSVVLMQSVDEGRSWKRVPVDIQPEEHTLTVHNLEPDQFHTFKLVVNGGVNRGESNVCHYYSGLLNVKNKGITGDGLEDDTDAINCILRWVNRTGGGVVLFPQGTYNVRTIQLQSNVWLYVDKGAVIKALPGADAPESTWFSDKAYRAGLSPTDPKPYQDPENYLTKQDVGHTFFRNAMFRGERLDNVKIIGTGRITGNGNLVTSDRVMNNTPEKRADKMFSLKLCTNIEIGGLDIQKEMWYDPDKDAPYYIAGENRIYDDSNMLHIDQGGHFVLLATGTDGIHVHDTYFAKYNSSNARDIYDFMACNEVTVTNIYSKVSSDDIVKPGSDCSLGFTRPARGYKVRNIVGDTNCNLFQIGSETADDIQDLCVDNIYVLGANKAGFSISTNDGGHIKNVHLNCGHTGCLHSRSVMHRTRAPFFISISNRGRVLGANVTPFTFTEKGNVRNELLVTNVNIGIVENIIINGVDITEVYSGSSFRGERWKPYDGSQNKATPIIAGFKIPDPEAVEGGLSFRLPNGIHTGYIKNVQFTDVNLLVKGGHPEEDATASPPEIGVGRYNVSDMRIQPSYGYWARHVDGLILKDCKIDTETPDGRYAVVLDDVLNVVIENMETPDHPENKELVKEIDAENVVIK